VLVVLCSSGRPTTSQPYLAFGLELALIAAIVLLRACAAGTLLRHDAANVATHSPPLLGNHPVSASADYRQNVTPQVTFQLSPDLCAYLLEGSLQFTTASQLLSTSLTPS
jgi:hypothetical protein